MKLVKQVSLYFQEGRSDKVYEVDLCEVGPGRFVVNFRYGRRGTALRDGTKTVAPVSRDEAERIFDRLVEEKVAKGYQHSPGSGPPEKTAPTPVPSRGPRPPVVDPRARAVLDRLRAGEQRGARWRLSRAVWRAGEMGLREAEPLLLPLVGSGDAMLDYCLAWALGRCGSAESVPVLRQLLKADKRPEPVRRMAAHAVRQVADEKTRWQAIATWIDQLPQPLSGLAANGPAEQFQKALAEYLDGADHNGFVVLELIYLIDNEHVRPALLHVLRTAPFAPHYFQRVRRILKAAEMRRDAEVFGLLAHRIETTRAGFSQRSGYYYYTKRKKPTVGPDAEKAFSRETRIYLRRRVWWTLRRLGELGEADYTAMAAGVLLAFTDDDAKPPRQQVRYDWSSYRRGQGYRTTTTHWDRFAAYWALNQILYHNSPRYQPDRGRRFFSCVPPYQPGGSPPDVREEAFPELWERTPERLLRLLLESRCGPVHEFAARAMRACKAFCRELPVETLVDLLESDYEVTAALGLDLAVDRYDPTHPDRRLVLALANCRLEAARQRARRWIETQRTFFLKDSDFAAALCAGRYPDIRAFAREGLRLLAIDEATAQAIVGRLFARLMDLGTDDAPVAADVIQTLLEVFGERLTRVGDDVIRDLLGHPLPEVQQFAGDLVLRHETLSRHPPGDVLQALLSAAHAPVRGIGVRIIGQLPDEVLKRSLDVLVALTRHEYPDVREAIRPVVARLAKADADFGRRIAGRLVEGLLVPGAPEGVPSHTSRVLREDLREHLSGVSAETVWKLLRSRSAPAQEVGGALLATNVRADDLSVEEIVKLGSHDVLTVREACWEMCRTGVERLRAEPAAAVRLLDSKWDDTRRFAAEFVRSNFSDGQLTPTLLVGICDSVRPEVQQLGRELITRHFRGEHGQEYLLKLSEHPSAALQLFASNYLEQYAAGSPERIRQLEPYLLGVLSRVNKGRVAKDRALAFLEAEAAKSEASAAAVAEIVARQSATCAVGDRARMIEIMVRIRSQYPQIPLPIEVQPVEVRGGV